MSCMRILQSRKCNVPNFQEGGNWYFTVIRERRVWVELKLESLNPLCTSVVVWIDRAASAKLVARMTPIRPAPRSLYTLAFFKNASEHRMTLASLITALVVSLVRNPYAYKQSYQLVLPRLTTIVLICARPGTERHRKCIFDAFA